MKINKIIVFSLIANMFLFASCEEDFLDINTDPNRTVNVQPDLLVTDVINSVATSAMDYGPGMMYWSKQWAAGSTNAGVFSNPEKYQMSIYSPGNVWGSFYTGLANLEHAKRLSLERNSINSYVQSEILKSYIVLFLTVVWEDVPYSEALQIVEFPHPKYDKQEDLLNILVNNLTDAVSKIDLEKKGMDEIIFKGEMSNWKKWGNFLKLKTLVLLANKDKAKYGDMLKAFLDTNPLLFESNDDNPKFPYFDVAGNKNPFFLLWENYGNSEPSYYYVSDEFLDVMGNDPRKAVWFEFGEDNDDVQVDYYKGVTQGKPIPEAATLIGPNTVHADAPFVFSTYSEQEFMLAEIYAGGFVGSSDLAVAKPYLTRALTSSMSAWNVPAAESDAFMSTFPDITGLSTDAALNTIYTQMYIGYYFMPMEGWLHVRRTGVPEVTAPEGAILDGLIRRWTLPTNEVTNNPNVPVAKKLSDKAWLDK
jgi:acyl dehydratase